MSAETHWVTVFDLAQSGFKDWDFAAFGLIFVAIGAFVSFAPRLSERILPNGFAGRARRLFGFFFLAFAVLWTTISFVTTFGEYRSLSSALRDGRADVVEGHVTNFHPMPYSGHQNETFDLGNAHFEYSDYEATPAFNNTRSHGGPIYEDRYVRITYFDGKIIRLEVQK